MALFDDVLNPQGQPPRLFDDVAPPKPPADTSKIDLSAPVGSEGFLGGAQDFLRGLGRGAVTTLPKSIGEAVDFFADRPTDTGKALQDFGDANAARFPALKESVIGQREQQDWTSLRGAAGQAGENTPLSVGPGLAGAAIGGVVGGLPGAAVGFVAGSLASLPIFYGSQGQQTADKVEKAQVAAGADPVTAHAEARIAGHESGAIEAGGELLADLIPFSKLAHPFVQPVEGALVKSIFSGGVKRSAATLGEMMAGEVSTEMGQQAGESAVEGAHGAGPGATWQDTASVILPTALMTLLPGAFTVAHNLRTVGNVKAALTDAEANASDRAAAANVVFEQIRQANPDVAQAFDRYAADQIKQGKPIEIADDSVYLAHAASAPSGPIAGAAQAATPSAPVNSDAGPVSRAAVTAAESGATTQAQAARQSEVDEAQHALDVKAAAEAAKPKKEGAPVPKEVEPPPVRPSSVSFPFATLEAAQKRAELMTKQSDVEWRAIPHPTVHDKFAVAAVDKPGQEVPPAATIGRQPAAGPALGDYLEQRQAVEDQFAAKKAADDAARLAAFDARQAAKKAAKEQPDAVQESGAGALLQREPGPTGEGGSERGRVQPGEQGNEAPIARTEEAAPVVGGGENAADHQENVARPEEGAGAVAAPEKPEQAPEEHGASTVPMTPATEATEVPLASTLPLASDQLDAGGKFDEHKVMLGFGSKVEAIGAYKANYPKGHKVGPVHQTTMDEFNAWARDKDQTVRPFNLRNAALDQRMKDIERERAVAENKKALANFKKGDRVSFVAKGTLQPVQSTPTIEAQNEPQEAPNGSDSVASGSSANGEAGDAGSRAGDVSRAPRKRKPRPGGEGAGGPVRGDLFAGERGGEDQGTAPVGLRGEGANDGGGGPQRSGTGARGGARIPKRRELPAGISDYRPATGELTRKGSWRDAASRNLDVIELVQKLEDEQRFATPDEQALLAKFVGWGAAEIRNNLLRTYQYSGKTELQSPESLPQAWRALGERTQQILVGEQLETALRSTQYAHYTSEPIVRGIWSALDRLGFKGGHILEPGMGNGLFPLLAPKEVTTHSSYTGIELDRFTAAIAKQLLPEQNVLNADFVKQKLPDGYFDLAVGNPPFARTKILDDPRYKRFRFSLHDYFFAKAMDKVRPGGILAFVTSRYSMDKAGVRARQYLAERADLLGAIRLPNTAFQENAGTEVVTDVLFFRRRFEGAEPAGEKWLALAEVQTPEGPTQVNEYFAAHPEMVLGRHSLTGEMRQQNEYTVLPHEGGLAEQFAAAVALLPANAYQQRTEGSDVARRQTFERDMTPTATKEGQLYVGDDGNLYRREQGTGRRVEDIKTLGEAKQQWLRSYIGLRDAMKQARYDQLTDGDWKASLKALNKTYDAFVKEHGPLNAYTERESVKLDKGDLDDEGNPTEKTVVTRIYKNDALMRMDVEAPLVSALETTDSAGNAVRGNFLLDRVLKKPESPKVETVTDALPISLSERGRLDLPHIGALLGKDVDTVISELGANIYQNPNGGQWELADQYLSGNVVQKLEEARVAASVDGQYDRNVDALYKVQPKPLGVGDVTVGLGAPWIDRAYIEDFASEVLGINTTVRHSDITGGWEVSGSGARTLRDPSSNWGTERRSPHDILDAALNNRTITIKDKIDKKDVTNPEATAAANEKVRLQREAFGRWIWTDAARAGKVLDEYNHRYNNLAPRVFDGSHLQLPGLSTRYNLFPHQKRAIWRVIQSGNTYLAHAVGAGKTLEMIVSGMEQKRLGLIRKPMYVVPNHMLNQFAREFVDAYPAAEIMVADEEHFHTDNRHRFVAQAAMNNPDAIIITHSAFGKLAPPAEATKKVLDRLIDDLRAMLDDLPKDERRSRAQIEQRIEQLERRFGSRVSEEGRDQVVGLDEMGVDHLYVDEAHEFRKLDFVTNRNQVKGINPVGSARALDLYIKVKALEEINPGRSHNFASGTPITNTLGELYSLQRFMDEDALIADGLGAFDSWASQFGEVGTFDERNAAGRYEVVSRFATFVNVPELMSRVRTFMDVLTSAQLRDLVKVPNTVGGGPKIELAQPSTALKAYMEVLAKRIADSRAWKPSAREPGNPDPLLAIITDGRLAAIDTRFVGRKSLTASKLDQMVERIVEKHQAYKDRAFIDPVTGKADPAKGATQIVFSAVGFGEDVAKNRGFDVRAYVGKRFREGGIAPDQVAWISDYKSHAKKEALFRDVREGKVRVLIGSPKNMGTGVNVQKRLKVLHYLAPPWYPSDVEQPHGRILRQGNQNDDVELFWYATQGTYDSTQWQMIARKGRFIEQAMAGGNVRKLEDISEVSQYEQASALASGDERVIKYTRLRRDVESLELLAGAHAQEQINLRRNADFAASRIRSINEDIAAVERAIGVAGDDYIVSSDARAQVAGRPVEGYSEIGEAIGDRARQIALNWKPASRRDRDDVEIGTLMGKHPIIARLTAAEEGKHLRTQVGVMVKFGRYLGRAYDIEQPLEERSSQRNATIGRAVALTTYDLGQRKQRLESDRRAAEGDKATYEKRIGAPFERQQEMLDKIAEAARLRDELVSDGQPSAEQVAEEAAALVAMQTYEGEGGRLAREAPAPQLSVADFPPRASMIRVAEPSTGTGHDVQELRDSFRQHFGIDFPSGSLVHADLPEHAASAVRAVAALYGKRIEFFRNTRPDLVAFNGVTLGGSTFYLNADAAKPHLQIAGHELLHHLRQEHPDLYGALRNSIRPLLKEDALDQYVKRRLGAHAERLDGDAIEEELIADVVGENFANPVFWSRLAQQNPSRFEQLAQAVLNFLRDLIGRFKATGFMARNYLNDFQRAQQAVVAAMGSYAGRNASKYGDGLALSVEAPSKPRFVAVYAYGRWRVRDEAEILGFVGSDYDTREKAESTARILSERIGSPLLSAAAPEDWVARGAQLVNDTLLRSPKQFGFLRPFQTQYQKAQTNRYFRPVFESAQAYIRDVSRFATDAADLADDLLPRLGKLRDVLPGFLGGTKAVDRTDVAIAGKATFASTLARVRPTKAQLLAGMTIKTDEGAIDIPKLTEAQWKLYDKARQAIDLALEQAAVSEAFKLTKGEQLDTVLDDAKADPNNGIGLIVNALREQADFHDHMGRPTEAIHKRGVAAQVADLGLRADELRAEGYAPLMRFGRYTVNVEVLRDGKPERVYFSMFESKAEMYQRERDMREIYPDAIVTTGTMDDAQWQLFQGLSLDSLAAFAETTGASKDPLFQDYFRLAVSSRSALKRLIHRKGIAGYSEDLQRVLATFITSQARLASKNFHFAEMTRLATAIPVQYGDVRTEAANLVQYVQNPTDEAAKIRGLLFVNFLGGSVASALTNMTQPFMMTAPYLSQYSNPAASAKALAGAMRTPDVPADAGLREALDRAAREGITDPQELHQLYAESIRGIGRNLQVRKGLRLWGSFFAIAERFNRRVTFIAAYRMAQDVGLAEINGAQQRRGLPTFANAFDFAEHAVEDTQGLYNRGNRPNVARGALGATVFTFKQFTIAYLEFLSRLPAREKAFAGALLFLAAGLQGAPGADDLEDLLDTLGQLMGFNTNSKQALREGAVRILGEHLGGFVTHGISGVPGVPMDIQARLGLGNLIPGTAIFKRSETDKTRDIAEFVGPVGSLYTQAMGGFTALTAGQGPAAVATFAAPTAIRNALQAVDMWTSGVYKDTRGRKVIDTTPADAAFKFLGLQPQDVAVASRKAQDVRQDIAMTSAVEASIADRWARAILDKNPDGVREAVNELHGWNLRNPTSPIAITPAQIRQRVQQAMLERAQRIAKSAPREIRGEARRGLQ